MAEPAGTGEPEAMAESAAPAGPTEPPPASAAAGETGAPAEWPFVVATHQEEAHETGTPPPPPTWNAGASSQTPLTESMASSARYIVIAGIALLVLSCLWVFLSIGTHLQARFGIFCLAPLGLIFLVVGLFLLLSRNANRRA